ncbi:MAG: type 2 lanthipeptide synthetase LanM, partial [Bacteroidota bacterium]
LHWMHTVSALIERFRLDEAELAVKFNNDHPLGTLKEFRFGMSDKHNGGFTTVVLQFDSGKKIVYKPKSLGTDRIVREVARWINSRSDLLELRTVAVIDKGDYGWQEFIEHEGCDDKAALSEFYQRAGYWLALVYTFEGYDYHHENMIAQGAFLYLIDTETIFNPFKESEVNRNGVLSAMALASDSVLYSVIRTGMLPNWNIGAKGAKKDTSGFGGSAVEGNDQVKTRRWTGLATDDIKLTWVERPVEDMGNQPYVMGEDPVSSDHFGTDIIAGFRSMYSFLLRNTDGLQALLRSLDATPVRFVRKATNLYASLLWRLSGPWYARDGMNWSAGVEYLAKQFMDASETRPAIWRLLEAEYDALMDLDIPYFKSASDSLHIYDGNGKRLISDYFTERCFDRIHDKIEQLSQDDLTLQEGFIRYTFYARTAGNFHSTEESPSSEASLQKEPTQALAHITAERCMELVSEIVAELEKEAIYAEDGSMAWIALEYLKEADVFQFKPISYNLYSGAVGVACFLAGCFAVTKQEQYYQLVDATLQPILNILDHEHEQIVKLSGIGGGTGLGSIIYGLATIADLLGETQLSEIAIAYAQRTALAIEKEQLPFDTKYDVIFGSAGLLLGLTKLYAVRKQATVLDQIEMTAQYLLEIARRPGNNGIVPTYDGKPVTGLSHGASGVALALLKAYGATGNAQYLEVAEAHIQFEEERFDEDAQNYPDYRSTQEVSAYTTSWCHGAPGIGLVRLKAFEITGKQVYLDQAERCMAKAGNFTLERIDHLCCGNFGRIDIQLEYARWQKDTNLMASLRKDAQYVLERSRAKGGFNIFMNTASSVFSPGLFVGATGIGYAMLRIAHPEKLPSILMYE